MRDSKIVIVGGGSNAWTPGLMRDMMLTPALSSSEFVLYDIDKRASDLTQAFLQKLAKQLGVKARITSTDDRTRALNGAQYIIITISTGGLKSMAHDLAIPQRYGIYHTVGDTTGPGGWARLIRNFDAFVSLAAAIRRGAPRAVVLNYTNPMSTLTDVLGRLHDGPVVGLCHGLFENLQFIKDYYGLDSEDQIAVQYAGLNHFFWITAARAGKIDVLADLKRRLVRRTFTDLLRDIAPDPAGFKSNRLLATELFRLTGVMPYLGDRHTCECFPWYITSKSNLKKYKLVRTSIRDRQEGFRKRREHLKEMIRGKIDEEFVRPSRETAANIISAHLEGRVFIDVGNLPNIGQVSNLPVGTTVETAMQVDRNGFTPMTFGALPESVVGFVQPYARVFALTVDACFRKDMKLALQALRYDPLCSHLNPEQVHAMGNVLLRAHRRFITAFQ